MSKSRMTPKQKQKSSKTTKRLDAQSSLDLLEQSVELYDPPPNLRKFSDLPLSNNTMRGLKKAFFTDMTDIQAKSIPHSLKGRDVLGSAVTGSGKTLSFLVPVLDILYRRKWGPMDGLGALIVSPTRELAVQIFEVLRSIGGYHSFSAGLVIGGKNLKDERDRLVRMNILVATPGRLLQHMDQTVGFEAGNLQLLVLDEADRILDMGFAKTLTALLSHLPKSRQTLLFSATQTQSVNDLARLSLRDPVSIGMNVPGSTMPCNLQQYYALCTLDKKLDALWGFLKSHLRSKILVFLSSGKQVRHVYETFCKMQPGTSLLHLHGKQKQTARLSTYDRFTSSPHAVLFATDIASRGLDFPSVDWVIQVDAPEDAETYIHRVGRTARYESKGNGLLLLLPSEEEGMKIALNNKSIELQKISIKAKKMQSIENILQKLAFEDPEIKYLAQRAFVSYLRSIHLHKDKSIFKLNELPLDRFAESLGLPGAPKVKFMDKAKMNKEKNAPRLPKLTSEQDNDVKAVDNTSVVESKLLKAGVRTKYDRMFERKNQNILSEHYTKLIDRSVSDNGSEEEDFITLKRVDHDLPASQQDDELPDEENLSKRRTRMGKAKRALIEGGRGKKLVFDDNGDPHEIYELADHEKWYEERGGFSGANEEGLRFAQSVRDGMNVTDTRDKREAREKKLEKKRKRKEREKAAEKSDGVTATLVPTLDEESESGSASSDQEERPTKRAKHELRDDLNEDEELALRLLRT